MRKYCDNTHSFSNSPAGNTASSFYVLFTIKNVKSAENNTISSDVCEKPSHFKTKSLYSPSFLSPFFHSPSLNNLSTHVNNYISVSLPSDKNNSPLLGRSVAISVANTSVSSSLSYGKNSSLITELVV